MPNVTYERKTLRPLDQRLKLYHRVLRLRRQGLRYGEIQRSFYTSEGIQIAKSTVRGWSNGEHQPLGKVNRFDSKPMPELA